MCGILFLILIDLQDEDLLEDFNEKLKKLRKDIYLEIDELDKQSLTSASSESEGKQK